MNKYIALNRINYVMVRWALALLLAAEIVCAAFLLGFRAVRTHPEAEKAEVVEAAFIPEATFIPEAAFIPEAEKEEQEARTFSYRSSVDACRAMFREEGHVIHAGGFVYNADGKRYDYANAFNALRASYDAGNRIVEIDFRLTTDGSLACVHDWYFVKAPGTGEYLQKAVSRNMFLRCRTRGGGKTMTLDELAAFMRERPDLYIVTDIKDSNYVCCRRIAEAYPDLIDRFVIQIYFPEEYRQIAGFGFRYFILTLYRWGKIAPETLVMYEKNHPLVGITMHKSYGEQADYIAPILDAGIPVYVHTVNDEKKMRDFYDAGIAGIYTDQILFTDTPDE